MMFGRLLLFSCMLVATNSVYAMEEWDVAINGRQATREYARELGINLDAFARQKCNNRRSAAEQAFFAQYKYEMVKDGKIAIYAASQFRITDSSDARIGIVKNYILERGIKNATAGLGLLYIALDRYNNKEHFDAYVNASFAFLTKSKNLQKTVIALNRNNLDYQTSVGRKCVSNAITKTRKYQPFPGCATNADLWIADHTTDTWTSWNTLIGQDGSGDYTQFKKLLNGDCNTKMLRLEFSYR